MEMTHTGTFCRFLHSKTGFEGGRGSFTFRERRIIPDHKGLIGLVLFWTAEGLWSTHPEKYRNRQNVPFSAKIIVKDQVRVNESYIELIGSSKLLLVGLAD